MDYTEEHNKNFEAAFAQLMHWEGGYLNDPVDTGGETMYGVTKSAWEMYTSEPWPGKLLTKERAKAFYKQHYWPSFRREQKPLTVKLACKLLDMRVLFGIGQTRTMILRACKACGFTADPFETSEEILTRYAHAENSLLVALGAASLCHFNWIVAREPKKRKFLAGWEKRATNYLTTNYKP